MTDHCTHWIEGTGKCCQCGLLSKPGRLVYVVGGVHPDTGRDLMCLGRDTCAWPQEWLAQARADAGRLAHEDLTTERSIW